MGQLLEISDFRNVERWGDKYRALRDPFWYFVDTRRNRTQFSVEQTYPHKLYIANAYLEGPRYEGEEGERQAALQRIEIRRWIEVNIAGDVIYDRLNMTYWRVLPKKANRSPSSRDRPFYDFPHGYYVFYFEHESDALAFRMRFSCVETKPSPCLPGHELQEGEEQYAERHEAERAARGW